MNSLRFPMEEFLFPPLVLSEDEIAEYERTARIVLSSALEYYDSYNRQDERNVSRTYWTPVKKHERLTVYKSLQKVAALPLSGGALHSADRAPLGLLDNPPEDWTMPTLLQVGSISGTLDDVMYGISTFDATDMLLEATYTPDEALDAEVLCEIQGPTPSDPFRFLGIKWLVLGNPPGINMVVRPRDMVFLEASGVVNRAVDGDGRTVERIGYLIMHSVHLPAHGPLLDKKIVRARTSSCYLFRQLPFGDAVDVFMISNIDPSGSVAETLAVQSAAQTLTYCGQVTACAYGKKLAWLLRKRQRVDSMRSANRTMSSGSGSSSSTISDGTADLPAFAAGAVPSADAAYVSSRSCAICSKKFGSLFSKRVSRCALCQMALCSSCRVKKKVSFPGPIRKEINVKKLTFCTSCLVRAGQLSAFEVAAQEVAARCRVDERLASLSSPPMSIPSSASPMPSRRRATDLDLGSRHRSTKAGLHRTYFNRTNRDVLDIESSADSDFDSDFEERVRRRASSDIASNNSHASSSSDINAADTTAASGQRQPHLALRDVNALARSNSVPTFQRAEAPHQAPTAQETLLSRLAELCSATESVYQLARLNTEAHLSQSASAMRQLQALGLADAAGPVRFDYRSGY